MQTNEDIEAKQLLQDLVDPWYVSLKNPAESQEQTLQTLLKGYAETNYGKSFDVANIRSAEDFQKFPVSNYHSLQSWFEEEKRGNHGSILSEPATCWVMTRGTTGLPKVIPATETHLSQILLAGSRAILNFALKKDLEVMKKDVLNLNFPSEVFLMTDHLSGETRRFGYSSGTYAKLNPSLDTTSLVPKQEEIDALGPGITKVDWERRFELVYERAKASKIGSVMGVTPVILEFGNFLRRKHHTSPRKIWNMNALFCTSVAKIHSKYAPILKHLYGNVPVVEMYSATEGVFAQQIDDLPYVSPNYDIYFFEVRTRKGIKPLHELRPLEWGSLIVSSTMLPRYEIGDIIESLGKNYFRVFGRAKKLTVAEHLFYNLFTGRILS